MRITLLHRTRECLFWRFRAGWKDSDRNGLFFDQEHFCCLIVLEEQSGSSLKVKRKENKTRWRLPDIVCPLDASAACIGLTSEAFGPRLCILPLTHISETREMVGHRKQRRGKERKVADVCLVVNHHICAWQQQRVAALREWGPKQQLLLNFHEV